VGIIVACLSVLLNIFFLAAFPLWSLIIIGIDILVIYALAIHGGELRD